MLLEFEYPGSIIAPECPRKMDGVEITYQNFERLSTKAHFTSNNK